MRIETPWGPWEAAPLGEVVALMRGLAAPWWVAGGYAMQAHEIEVQLLYKAKGTRPKDQADFEAVLPLLSDGQRRWLDEALETEHTTHPWRERLRRDP
ncbi:hypothetical protein [Nonomuraea cavernae]|uniref:hypothetical protein n=1 Tax=Nonomuraea cavernae TaxID=2045107 RepID=UPI0033C27CB9